MRSSSSSLFARRAREGLALALFLAGSVFGCFRDPKIDVTQPRKCQTDKSCPGGYVCGSNGFCCASSDGKTCSNPVSTGGAGARIDGSSGDDAPTGAGDRRRRWWHNWAWRKWEQGGGGNGGVAGSGGIFDGRGTGGGGEQRWRS
jgi:hypothetical protein